MAILMGVAPPASHPWFTRPPSPRGPGAGALSCLLGQRRARASRKSPVLGPSVPAGARVGAWGAPEPWREAAASAGERMSCWVWALHPCWWPWTPRGGWARAEGERAVRGCGFLRRGCRAVGSAHARPAGCGPATPALSSCSAARPRRVLCGSVSHGDEGRPCLPEAAGLRSLTDGL